jgi:putative SOS response-associated peptidase YedK
VCGRFTFTTPAELVAQVFGLDDLPELAPRYNIAPTQDVAVVRPEDGRRRIAVLRWGLITSKAPSGAPLINVRSESLSTRPFLRDAFAHRRCLIPTDGFYEWRRIGRAREPFHIRRPDGAPFAFAGLWSAGPADGANAKGSCAILTTEANETVRKVHGRMPVIVPAADYDLWLDPTVTAEDPLRPILAPTRDALLAISVGPTVNNARNDDPSCLRPAPTLL